MRFLRLLALVATGAAAALAACGDPFGLLGASSVNVVDSLVSLYALTRTPVGPRHVLRLALAVRPLCRQAAGVEGRHRGPRARLPNSRRSELRLSRARTRAPEPLSRDRPEAAARLARPGAGGAGAARRQRA